ncbi:MAG TPA: AgmX/PglI C-terminal domain-containing protein [Polyangiaceae bacterium]
MTGPRVLRIGVVQSGRVSEERIIKQRSHVSVGSSADNTFVLSTSAVPATFRLFELIGQDYHLNFLEHMTGRVALTAGVSELSALKAQAERGPRGVYRVVLSDDARGKIVIGDTTLLFQLVPSPPVQPTAQLPLAVLRSARAIDWSTTTIAAVSFLVHFLVLGSLYSDWVDPVVDDETSVAGALDSLKALPPPPPLEDHDRPQAETNARPTPEHETAQKSAPQKASAARPSEKPAAALSNELEKIELLAVGSLRSERAATLDVLKHSELPLNALDRAAESAAGVGVGTGELTISPAGGAIRPGVENRLGDIGSKVRTGGTEGNGLVAKVVGPQGRASLGSETTVGVVSNASQVVAAMRPGFRSCYQRYGLAENPDAAGSIRLTIRVGAGGEVAGVSASSSGSLPAAVLSCVQARARVGQFNAPEGGSAVVVVPVTFVKQ